METEHIEKKKERVFESSCVLSLFKSIRLVKMPRFDVRKRLRVNRPFWSKLLWVAHQDFYDQIETMVMRLEHVEPRPRMTLETPCHTYTPFPQSAVEL